MSRGSLSRRTARTVLAALAVALLGSASMAQTPAPRVTDMVPLAEGVLLLPGRFERGRQPDGNSVLLQGREGWIVIDTGRHIEHTTALLDALRTRGQPLRAVVNTHWHLDHLGGNAMLRQAQSGWRAYASRALREAVATQMTRSEADLRRLLEDPATDAATRRMVEIDLALYAQRSRLMPDELLDGPPRDVEIAGRRLHVGVERGVSGGDVWVLDRASGILAVGDFVTVPAPFLDTACPAEWRAAMQRLDALPYERVVPGHGPVMSRQDFGRYRRALDGLLECAAGEQPVATCSAAWVADLGPLLPAPSHGAAAAMLNHYFAEHLRAPAAQRDRHCAKP